MKKILSVVLVLIILVSCIYTGVWADDINNSGTNIMSDYTYRDWKVTSRATINAPTESFSGDMSNAFSVTKLMWRSAYTSVNLEAGETYELSFYYKEDAPDKVWLTDNGNRGVAMAPANQLTVSGVDEIAVDYSINLLNDINYNIPSDKEGWYVVSAEIKPSVSGEHLLYFTGAAASDGSGNGNLDRIHFSDFSLVKKQAEANVLADSKAADWISGWNGNTGVSIGDAIAVKTAWRSGYTKVTLNPNTTYNFTFEASTVKISDIRVYAADEITTNAQLTCPAGGGNLPGGINNLANGSFNSSAHSGDFATLDAETVGSFYTVSESFTTGDATEYYIILDCTQFLNNGSVNPYCTFVHIKNLSLVAEGVEEQPETPDVQDSNILNDEAMKALNWSALWGSSAINPKSAEPDKSQSYSGSSYVMVFNRNSRWRDNYTTITLAPNTTYDFSLRYKSGTLGEHLDGIGFVDASKTDFSTIKGDRVANHLTDASTPILGKSEAVIEKVTDGSWNEVKTTFTTSDSAEYVMYLQVNYSGGDATNFALTLSDFSLVAKEEETPEDRNLLNDEVMKTLNWSALWGSLARNPKVAEPDKSQSYSGSSYVMVFDRNSRWRDNYTTITLAPNTTYDFSLRYKSGTLGERLDGIGFVDASKTDFSTIKGDRVANHLTDASTPILGKSEAVIEKATDGSWNEVKTTFTTSDSAEYVMYLQVNYNGGDATNFALTLSDFSLVAKENTEPQDNNFLKEEVMKKLEWNALWGSLAINPKSAEPDKSQSYSGSSYVMVFNRNSRWRDNYTTITLAPNTTYDFSLRYKSGTLGEHLDGIGFVDASKTDFSTIKGDRVANHLTDASTPILGKSEAVIEKATDGSWNEVKTTFTTSDSAEYVMYLQVNYRGGDATNFALTLSDFSLVAKEEETPEEPEQVENVLANTKGSDWTSSWGSVKGIDEGGAIKIGVAYRSAYTKVTLNPNTKYELSFNHGEVRVSNIRVYDAAEITDITTQMVSGENGGAVQGGNTDLSPSLITTNCPATPVAGRFYKSSESFTTTSATEYYIILDCTTFSTTSIVLKDLKLVEVIEEDDDQPEKPVDTDNILVNTKASEWTSSWGPAMGVPVGDAISLRAAYRSAYTKVTLKPNVTYHFNFNFEHVKINDIRVYDAAEITDLTTQMVSGENGGAVTGGKINLATDAITTDCSIPEPNKVYSAFEEFTTSSATEYYIILDFASGDGVSNNIILKNLSLKKYYDPITDIFGTISCSMGGSVQNKGKLPYEKGKQITIKATPLAGNTFIGWFDVGGKKVSTDTDYSFVVDKEFDLIAKFSGPNMPYVDWMAENGMDGTFENGEMPGWYAIDKGTGVLATFATFKSNTYASHSGEKAMAMRARYQHSYFHFNKLSKNSDYYLSFYIYCPDTQTYDPKAEIGHRGFKVNEMYVDVGGEIIWSKGNIFNDGNNGWHRVEFFFNTGNADNATLCINYYGDANVAEKAVYLDDVTFVQYMANDLKNGDFSGGNQYWMGEYATKTEKDNSVAEISADKKIYQSVDVEPHSLYTVSFRAKGKLLAAASKINNYSTDFRTLISSATSVKTTGDEAEYSFDIYTGMNSAINLVFEALEDGALLDDIKITKQEDAADAVVEKIDFETDRFAIKNSTTNKDVYEIYEGTEFARSGNKSLHFKYDAADDNTEYVFNESYLGFQISNSRVYRLTFYYKTSNGSTIKISPDFLGTQAGNVGVKHTAKGDGWNRVDFFASSSSAIYFDPIIANIVGETKADFYVDDITYTIVSAAVLETNVKEIYAEPPLALLYNEGFEEPITNQNWGKLPSTTKVLEGDTEFGNKYLRVEAKTFYVLPVAVEAGVQYYLSASLRGTGGYIGLSTTADGKEFFNGISGEKESFIKTTSPKWQRSGIKFSAPMNGVVYLVIACDKGYLEADNILIYKESYALTEKPYGHDILKPYDYTATSGENYILNGGYTDEELNDGSTEDTPNADDTSSPSTGDNFPATMLIIITLISAMVLMISSKKSKKEVE